MIELAIKVCIALAILCLFIQFTAIVSLQSAPGILFGGGAILFAALALLLVLVEN